MSFNPFESPKFMQAVHENAPIEKNVEILFKNVTIGDKPFLDLFRDCMEQSKAPSYSWKVFRRSLRAFNLAQYFDYSLDLEGARAECGVFTGFSALLMAEIHRMRDPGFNGEGFHLIDSFEGLSQPTPDDAIGFQDDGNDGQQPVYSFQKGHFAVGLETVKETMKSFAETRFHKGWIPKILETLPEQKWAFVHVDVDLFKPTNGCMEYFVPRMVKGGCILNDDFFSPMVPGGGSGWHEYCDRHGLSYAILDSGQSVLICE